MTIAEMKNRIEDPNARKIANNMRRRLLARREEFNDGLGPQIYQLLKNTIDE